jgi:hypothetical protein
MQISVHAFPLSERNVDNGTVAPVTQSGDSVKDGKKTEQQALGLADDQVSLSDQAKTSREAGDHAGNDANTRLNAEDDSSEAPAGQAEDKAREKAEQEVVKQQVDQLKQRDREVRAHELAHAVTGGAYAGSPKLEYTRGPDGVQYATGGEVSVDTSPIAGDPQATIEKARIVRAAALAPASPSGQDRAVAARASQMGIDANAELVQQRSESRAEQFSENQEGTNNNPPVGLAEKVEGISVYEGLKSENQSGSYFDQMA